MFVLDALRRIGPQSTGSIPKGAPSFMAMA
jgi:hypothetical protein